MYAMIVNKGSDIVDVVYWQFYPYNQGNRRKNNILDKGIGSFFEPTYILGNRIGDW